MPHLPSELLIDMSNIKMQMLNCRKAVLCKVLEVSVFCLHKVCGECQFMFWRLKLGLMKSIFVKPASGILK